MARISKTGVPSLKQASLLFFILLVVVGMGVVAPMIRPDFTLESFLSPGDYPLSVDKPLLVGDYNLSPNPGVTNNGSQDIYTDYPVFPARSCGNNNIRYWRRPNNGKCAPASMCGGLYTDTNQKIPPQPMAPKWDSGIRVNYFESSPGDCA